MKKTPWFKANSFTPVRNGWYEVKGSYIPNGFKFYFYEGRWYDSARVVSPNVQYFGMGTDFENDYWRGLVSK